MAVFTYSLIFYLTFLFLLMAEIPRGQSKQNSTTLPGAAEKTQSIALLFAYIQCFPNNSHNLDPASQELFRIHRTFDPRSHLSQYINLTDIQNLINLVTQFQESHTPVDLPFTNAPGDIAQLNVILTVLYHNAQNWPLFYQTCAWLLQRVNSAQLFWAVMVVSAEKFGNTVAVPSSVEIFPQLFLPKNDILSAAGLDTRSTLGPPHPLQYWMGDPGLNNFHVFWHILNPYWWNKAVYGVTRHRKGELFLYFHHQVICRYNAELQSHGIGEVEPLGITPNYSIPEGYHPDIVNINYADFFSRENGKFIGDYDDGSILKTLQLYRGRLEEGIEQGFFVDPEGDSVSIRNCNGTNLLGSTVESSNSESVNWNFYGSFHNYMHRVLAGMLKPQEFPIPGIESHSETSMRDPVFYRIHKRVDTLYLKYKSTLPPYTQEELDFLGISVLDVKIRTYSQKNPNYLQFQPVEGTTLSTYFRTETFDISNAARPCRAITDKPVPAQVKILDHVPFTYEIALKSERSTVAYGMVRIFMWPEYNNRGEPLKGDEAHARAIELDRFRVRMDPGKVNVVTRSSTESSLTKRESAPGIKELYRVQDNSKVLGNPETRSACGFPNNLLIPRGNKKGLPFRLMVYVSEETEGDFMEEKEYPHYPFCGVLNGLLFPDKRPMGFPFDRPGTRFQKDLDCSHAFPCFYGGTNSKEIKVVVKHIE